MIRALVVVALLSGVAAADDGELYGEGPREKPSEVDLYGKDHKSTLLDFRLRDFPVPLRAIDPRIRAAVGYELDYLPSGTRAPNTLSHTLMLDLPGLSLRMPATRTGDGAFYVGDTTIALGAPIFAGRRGAHDWHLTPAAVVMLGDENGVYADDNAYSLQLAAGRAAEHFSIQLIPALVRFPVREIGAPAGGADAVGAGTLVLGARESGVELLLEVAGAVAMSGDLAGQVAVEVGTGLRVHADDWTLTLGAADRIARHHLLYGTSALDRPAAAEVMVSLSYLVGGLDGKLDRK